ncbi:MAG: flagellar hook-associated protein 3 [Candidatus Neomarinimicrobiota bacterium]|nr:MAG: flagellar hook-associated protein 3 [Candidatus Neomarinimicrobiota bacterium]
MRVTQSMMTRTLISNLNKGRESMSTSQSIMSTGKNLQSASDDPVKYATTTRYKETYSQNEQYQKNILDAKGWVDTTSSILNDIYSNVLSAKDLAYSAADSSSSTEELETMADQLEGFISEIYSLTNSKYLGKYLFSGTRTVEDKPFDYDGSTVDYIGNEGKITRRISEGYDATINISGDEIMNTDVFENLISLRDAMLAGDRSAISDSIGALEQSAQDILSIQSKTGSLSNLLDMTNNRLEVANTNLSSLISELEDADLTEVIAQYNSNELAYQAALQATSSVLNLNILDFL